MGHSPRGILVRLPGETLLAGETWLIRYVDVRKVDTYVFQRGDLRNHAVSAALTNSIRG